jgi:hypothetical protein
MQNFRVLGIRFSVFHGIFKLTAQMRRPILMARTIRLRPKECHEEVAMAAFSFR